MLKNTNGKRGEVGAYALRKNHKKSGCTNVQTDTSSWKPGVAEKEAPSAQLGTAPQSRGAFRLNFCSSYKLYRDETVTPRE